MRLLRFLGQALGGRGVRVERRQDRLHVRPDAADAGERVVHGARLVAAVHHAVLALRVAALDAVVRPLGLGDEFLERVVVALLQEVARLLPAEDVVGRAAPRGALEIALAHEELEEERAHVELPALLAVGEDHLEQLVGLAASEEALLVGRLVVGVARGHHHSLHAQVHHLVEEAAHRGGVGTLEERGVGGDAEAHLDRQADALDGLLEGALAADGEVMVLFLAVHVDAEAEVLARLEPASLQLLLQEECVGAEVDVLLARHQRLDQLLDLRVEERLAAGDAHHGSAALVDGLHALRHAQVLLEDVRRVLDLAAPCARQVAAEERLEHQHQGIVLVPAQTLSENVRGNGPHLGNRDCHWVFPGSWWVGPAEAGGGGAKNLLGRSELGRSRSGAGS